MENNIPRITEQDIIDNHTAFYVVKKCLDCAITDPDNGTEVMEMQFPTMESAVALLEGFTKVGVAKHKNAEYKDGILYMTDGEGNSHRYIQAVMTGIPKILWQTTDEAIANQEIASKFNDIMNGVELDGPTE